MAGRGVLTEDIQKISQKHIGRNLTRIEFRLLPYLQFVMMNEQYMERNKINTEERRVLSEWREQGYIGGSGLRIVTITKEFWMFLSEVLFYGYVENEDS